MGSDEQFPGFAFANLQFRNLRSKEEQARCGFGAPFWMLWRMGLVLFRVVKRRQHSCLVALQTHLPARDSCAKLMGWLTHDAQWRLSSAPSA